MEICIIIYLPKLFKNIFNNKENLLIFLYNFQYFINLVINN